MWITFLIQHLFEFFGQCHNEFMSNQKLVSSLLLLCFVTGLAGCASNSRLAKKSRSATSSHRVGSLDEKVREMRQRRQTEIDARDRKIVLSAKMAETSGASSNFSEPISDSAGFDMGLNHSSPLERKGLTEQQLFAEIVDRFDSSDLIGFELRRKTFMSQFSKSALVPEVLYMKGLTGIESKEYGMALAQFNKILKDYKNHPRASSSLYAKAMTYKKMNLMEKTKRMLEQLRQEYSASPEAERAQSELMLL